MPRAANELDSAHMSLIWLTEDAWPERLIAQTADGCYYYLIYAYPPYHHHLQSHYNLFFYEPNRQPLHYREALHGEGIDGAVLVMQAAKRVTYRRYGLRTLGAAKRDAEAHYLLRFA